MDAKLESAVSWTSYAEAGSPSESEYPHDRVTGRDLVHAPGGGDDGDAEGGSSTSRGTVTVASVFPAASVLLNDRRMAPCAAGRNGPVYTVDGPELTENVVVVCPDPASDTTKMTRFDESSWGIPPTLPGGTLNASCVEGGTVSIRTFADVENPDQPLYSSIVCTRQKYAPSGRAGGRQEDADDSTGPLSLTRERKSDRSLTCTMNPDCRSVSGSVYVHRRAGLEAFTQTPPVGERGTGIETVFKT